MFIFSLIYLFNIILIKSKKCNLLLIFPCNKRKGPGNFAYYINKSIYDWNKSEFSKYCKITLKKSITLSHIINYLSKSSNYIWFQSAVYLFNKDINYRNVLYGPNLSPIRYFKFPLNNTHEMKWIEIINKIKYYIVHHNRISNHLMNRTKSYHQFKKYLIFPCCIMYERDSSILKWENRNFDFLIYIKYIDSNHMRDGNTLINSLNSTYKVIVFYYGYYTTNILIKYAKTSKVVIYFSFYDTGAIALLEMQRMGVFTITLQKEFITNENGIYLPELEYNIQKAISKLNEVIKRKYDSVYIAEYNRKKGDCKKYFYKLVNKLK